MIELIHGGMYNYIMKSYKTIWINSEKKQKRLHRYLMEQYIGRNLLSSELVHHINEDIHDNRIKNLEILTRSEHKKRHPEIGVNTRFNVIYNISKQDLKKLRSDGLSMAKISKIFKCTQPTIFRRLKQYGIN